ncbi:hypothetical protein ALO86_200088 [Pseudomonas syringae pv. berberidis]|nr:hypothetical protein ALO86_200088 [Pseudomonas syringae pv. berberidis]
MPTQLEEVIVAPCPIDTEQLLPDIRQCTFDFACRRLVVTTGVSVVPRRRQCPTVQLAIGRQRPFRQFHIRCRHHVFRQPRLQGSTQCLRRNRLFRFLLCVIRRQTLLARRVLSGNHHRFPDVRYLFQLRLDLAQFDTQASYLDLIVVAPQVFDITVRQPAPQIAAPVHPRCRLGTERILDETLRRQFRQIQIATANPRTADMDLAADPNGYWLAVGIQQINLRIGYRTAYVQYRLCCIDQTGCRHNRCLGRTIVVDQRDLTIRIGKPTQPVSANQQRLQRGRFDLLGECHLGNRRRQEAHIQILPTPPPQQCIHIVAKRLSRQQRQAGSHTQSWPYFPGAGIETDSRHARNAIVMGQIECIAVPSHQVNEIAMLNHHALGLAGRTRGIDHISQVLWRDCRRHAIKLGLNRPVRALQIQHRHRQRTQQLPCFGLHQHRHRRAVLQHVAQPLQRIPRVQRHICTASLQDPQQAHHHLHTTFHTDRHAVVGNNAQ